MKLASLAALAFALASFPATASADTVYTVDNASPPLLAKFDSASPGNVTRIGTVTGMASGDSILAFDFRPSNGRLYAVSAQSRLYTVDTSTAAATAVSEMPFAPPIAGGASVGADFDPVRDVLRVITDGVGGAALNLRVNPDTGVATIDTAPNKDPSDNTVMSAPCIAGLGYTNDFQGATATTLYALAVCGSNLLGVGSPDGDPLSADSGRFALVEHTDPGVHLQQDFRIGLDIAPGGTAYALVQQGPSVVFYQVDLRPGAYTLNQVGPGPVGDQPVASGDTWRDIAVAPVANEFALNAATYSASETAGSATVTVTRAGPLLGTASVNYTTSDGSATSPADYTPASGTLQFAAGQASATFSVPIADDTLLEGPESLNLTLSSPAGGAASLAAPSVATLTIDDNEIAPPPPPDLTPPVISNLRLLRARFAAAKTKVKRGTAFLFTLSENAKVTILIERKVKTGYRRAGSLAAPLQAGARKIAFSGRLGGKALKPGVYRATLTAVDAAGNSALPRRIKLRVVPRTG